MAGNPLVGYSIANGLAPLTKPGADGGPIQGPRVICLPFTFTAGANVQTQEFFREAESKQLDFIQTVKINNQASALSLTISADVTQDTWVIPAGKQVIVPLLTIADCKITLSKPVVGAAETILVWFSDVPMAPFII